MAARSFNIHSNSRRPRVLWRPRTRATPMHASHAKLVSPLHGQLPMIESPLRATERVEPIVQSQRALVLPGPSTGNFEP